MADNNANKKHGKRKSEKKRKANDIPGHTTYDHNIFDCPLIKKPKKDTVQYLYADPVFLAQAITDNKATYNRHDDDQFFDCSGSEVGSLDNVQQQQPGYQQLLQQHSHKMADVINNIQDPHEFKSLLKEVAQTSQILYRAFKRAYHKAKKANNNGTAGKTDSKCRKCSRRCQESRHKKSKKPQELNEKLYEEANACYCPFEITDVLLGTNGMGVKCDNAACDCVKGQNDKELTGAEKLQHNYCDCLEKCKRLLQGDNKPDVHDDQKALGSAASLEAVDRPIPNLCAKYDMDCEGLNFCERCAKLRGEPVVCKKESNNSVGIKSEINFTNYMTCNCNNTGTDPLELCRCMEIKDRKPFTGFADVKPIFPKLVIADTFTQSKITTSIHKVTEPASNISANVQPLSAELQSPVPATNIQASQAVEPHAGHFLCHCSQLNYVPLTDVCSNQASQVIEPSPISQFNAAQSSVNFKNCFCLQSHLTATMCPHSRFHKEHPAPLPATCPYFPHCFCCRKAPSQQCQPHPCSKKHQTSSKSHKEKSSRKPKSIQMEPISFTLPINLQIQTHNGETRFLQTQVAMEAYAENDKRKPKPQKNPIEPIRTSTIAATSSSSQTQTANGLMTTTQGETRLKQKTQAGGFSVSSDMFYSCSSSSVVETTNRHSPKPCESLLEIFDLIKNRVAKGENVPIQMVKTMVSYDFKECLAKTKSKPSIPETTTASLVKHEVSPGPPSIPEHLKTKIVERPKYFTNLETQTETMAMEVPPSTPVLIVPRTPQPPPAPPKSKDDAVNHVTPLENSAPYIGAMDSTILKQDPDQLPSPKRIVDTVDHAIPTETAAPKVTVLGSRILPPQAAKHQDDTVDHVKPVEMMARDIAAVDSRLLKEDPRQLPAPPLPTKLKVDTVDFDIAVETIAREISAMDSRILKQEPGHQPPPVPPPPPPPKRKADTKDHATPVETSATKITATDSRILKQDPDQLPAPLTPPTRKADTVDHNTAVETIAREITVRDSGRRQEDPDLLPPRIAGIQPLPEHITRKINALKSDNKAVVTKSRIGSVPLPTPVTEGASKRKSYDLTLETAMRPETSNNYKTTLNMPTTTKVSETAQTDFTSAQAEAHIKRTEMRREIIDNLSELLRPATPRTKNQYEPEEIDEILIGLHTIFYPKVVGSKTKDEIRESILEDLRLILSRCEAHTTISATAASFLVGKKSLSTENLLMNIAHILNPKMVKKPSKHYSKDQRERILEGLNKLLKIRSQMQSETQETRDGVLLNLGLLLHEDTAQVHSSSQNVAGYQDEIHVKTGSVELPVAYEEPMTSAWPRRLSPKLALPKKLPNSSDEFLTDEEKREPQTRKRGPPAPKKPNTKMSHQQKRQPDDDGNNRRTFEVDNPEQMPASPAHSQIGATPIDDGISSVSTSSDTFFIHIDENLPEEYPRSSKFLRRSRFYSGNDQDDSNLNGDLKNVLLHRTCDNQREQRESDRCEGGWKRTYSPQVRDTNVAEELIFKIEPTTSKYAEVYNLPQLTDTRNQETIITRFLQGSSNTSTRLQSLAIESKEGCKSINPKKSAKSSIVMEALTDSNHKMQLPVDVHHQTGNYLPEIISYQLREGRPSYNENHKELFAYHHESPQITTTSTPHRRQKSKTTIKTCHNLNRNHENMNEVVDRTHAESADWAQTPKSCGFPLRHNTLLRDFESPQELNKENMPHNKQFPVCLPRSLQGQHLESSSSKQITYRDHEGKDCSSS